MNDFHFGELVTYRHRDMATGMTREDVVEIFKVKNRVMIRDGSFCVWVNRSSLVRNVHQVDTWSKP